MKISLFGASGKIGRHALRLFQEKGHALRVLCHQTPIEGPDITVTRGSVTDPAAVDAVVSGADVVIQMATTKEDPATFFDVSLKGAFHILEACRRHEIRQFILLGGDAAVGIWFFPHPDPIDETHRLMAYPGYYAFSKVIEEEMTLQYHFQYGLPYTILRSSWVFENDDLLNHFSLLKNVDPTEKGHGFGNPGPEVLDLVRAGQERLPVLIDAGGNPLRRHIVHIDDVIQALDRMAGNESALNETFHIAGPSAFDYRSASGYLSGRTGIPTVEIPCPDYHSFEIDIGKARRVLGYDPQNDFETMADRALAFRKRN